MSILRNAIGTLLGYGSCPRCGRTWWGSDPCRNAHYIDVCHGLDTWAICARCWAEMTDVERTWATGEAIAVHIAAGHWAGDCPHRTVDEAIGCLAVRVVPPLCVQMPFGPGPKGVAWSPGPIGPTGPASGSEQ